MIDDVKIMMENEQLIEHSTEYSQLLNSELGKERIRSYISSLLPNLTAILEVRYGGFEGAYFKNQKNEWYCTSSREICKDSEDAKNHDRIVRFLKDLSLLSNDQRDITYKHDMLELDESDIISRFIHDFVDKRGSTVFFGLDAVNLLVYIIIDSCSSVRMLCWGWANMAYIGNVLNNLFGFSYQEYHLNHPMKLMDSGYNTLITTVNEIIHDISPHHVELDTREHDYWESGR